MVGRRLVVTGCLCAMANRTFSQYTLDGTDLTQRCTVANAENWSLISWYFGRCMLMMITVISEPDSAGIKWNFASSYIYSLMENMDIPAIITERTTDYEEEHIGNSDLYNWQGELFENRPVNRAKRHISLSNRQSNRMDEPAKGMVVVVMNIDMLDNYLIGPARSPFRNPLNNYVIVLRTISEDWQETAERVLRKLWYSYGIANALLMTPCADSGSEMFATYYPFTILPSVSNPKPEDYGSVRWTHVNEVKTSTLLNKLAQMNRFPFRVSIFVRYPTVLVPSDISNVSRQSYFNKAMQYSGGFGGFDGMVLGNIARKMNFQTIVVTPNISDYGYVDENGSYFGSLGDVLYRKAAVSMNGRFISDYGTTEIDYLFPVNFDRFCIIAPKALKIPQWKAIFRCFNEELWCIIMVMNLICCFVWCLLRTWRQNHTTVEMTSHLTYLSLEMFLIMFSAPSVYMPKRTMERLFMAACLMSTVIIVGFFQGTLTTSYSTVSFYKDINSLAELDASGLPIGTTSNSLIDLFGSGGSPLIQSLTSKFDLYKTGRPMIDRTAYERDICCIERCNDIEVIISTRYETPDGRLLHAIPESPKYCQMAYIVKKGWPYMAVFNEIIHRFHQAGLLTKWYSETQDTIIQHERIHHRSYVETLRVLTMVDLQTAFYILGIGLGCCMLVLLVEIFVAKRQRQVVCNDRVTYLFPFIE